MPTYEYKCRSCGLNFERQQAITANAITVCPTCNGAVERVISAGAGFIIQGYRQNGDNPRGHDCSLEKTGQTCCGRAERCGKPSCAD